ncbi:MAG: c-type cytochrome [Myxococcales bacterium]|nr:c-type cytochrome [Myxococcales bacterium]
MLNIVSGKLGALAECAGLGRSKLSLRKGGDNLVVLESFTKTLFVAALLLLASGGCSDKPVFTEPLALGGVTVPADVLEQGRRVYKKHCLNCHGGDGDGTGVSAYGQWPAPRDFRSAKFKFAGVAGAGLASDEELERIITLGLKGTYMRPWALKTNELQAVVQYIKTFSPEGGGYRSESLRVKAPAMYSDPYASAEQFSRAVAEGEELYHVVFQCAACHPAYVSRAQLEAWGAPVRAGDASEPVASWSNDYNAALLPPDFRRHQMRSVASSEGPRGILDHDVADIYRAITMGLQGAMPGFGHLGAERAWAVAHYVKSLADVKHLEPSKEPEFSRP